MASADCQYCGGLGHAPIGPTVFDATEPCAICAHEDVERVWLSDREYYIECVHCGALP